MSWIEKNLRSALALSVALLLGIGFGYTAWKENQTIPEDVPVEVQSVGKIGKPSIIPATEVLVRYRFLLCGHTLEKDETGGEFIGCTLEDITQKYADARVLELNNQKAIIERELERYCPDHYMLFMDNKGEICVSNTAEEDYTKEVLQVLNFDAVGLDDEITAELENGVLLNTLEEVNSYLESIEG